jgi:hypothetical protein
MRRDLGVKRRRCKCERANNLTYWMYSSVRRATSKDEPEAMVAGAWIPMRRALAPRKEKADKSVEIVGKRIFGDVICLDCWSRMGSFLVGIWKPGLV